MEAPIVGRDAYDFLRENDRADVLGVYHAGTYLRVGDDLLLLCDRTRGVVPFGVSLPDYPALFARLESAAASEVTVDRRDGITLYFGDLALPLGKIEPDARVCRIACLPKRETLYAVAERLAARTTGFAPLCNALVGREVPAGDAALARAAVRVPAVCDALLLGTEPPVAPLVGLGYGLTPSGDDLLAGMLYAARYFTAVPRDFADRLGAAVEKTAGGTNLISRRYLAAAVSGARFDATADFCEAIAAGADFTPALSRLLAVGASSGGDIATGILTLLFRVVPE